MNRNVVVLEFFGFDQYVTDVEENPDRNKK